MLNEKKIVSDKNLLFAEREPKLHYLKISENSDEYLKIWIKEPTWLQVEQGMASVMNINPKTQEMDIDLNNLFTFFALILPLQVFSNLEKTEFAAATLIC